MALNGRVSISKNHVTKRWVGTTILRTTVDNNINVTQIEVKIVDINIGI